MAHQQNLDRDNARRLRREQTDAEHAVWDQLSGRKFLGLKFRRQHQLSNYFVDFCCIEKLLIIELDGSQHDEQIEQDERRTKWLNAQGFRVLRFWNNHVLLGIEGSSKK
jgi:very-short-patch-repair endonuclease